MSYPTSVTAVPTTTSPTTPSTSSTSSSSSSNASTTPRTTATATSVATTVPTTIISTNPYGSTTIVTTEISTTTPVVGPTPSPVNNSSNTGAIVGGVVGGIVVIALLVLLLFCLRRRRRPNQLDGNFDSNRIISHPQVDLGEENDITPLSYPDGDGSMRQYGESPFLVAGAGAAGLNAGAAAAGATSPPNHSGTATSPGQDPSQGFVRPGPGQYPQGGPNMYAMQQADWHAPRPLTLPAQSAGVASSSGRGMKEQEAAAVASHQGLGLPTQQEVDGEGSGIVQHQDTGQLPSEGGREQRDAPPAYESIRQ